MITTSNDFLVAAKATVRQVKAKMDITWVAPSEDPSITVHGSTPEVEGFVALDGINDVIGTPFENTDTELTFVAWVDPVLKASYLLNRFVSGSSPVAQNIFSIDDSTGKISAWLEPGNSTEGFTGRYTANTGVSPLAWFTGGTDLLVIRFQYGAAGTSVCKVTVNTTTVTMTASTSTLVNGIRLPASALAGRIKYYIGKRGVDNTNPYEGKMSQIMIYEKYLSDADVAKLYTQDYANMTDPPTTESYAYYKCNESSGNLTDSSGNSNTGVPQNVASTFYNPDVYNDTNRAANLKQIYDGDSTIPKRWAHLDGLIKADGVYKLMPDPNTVGAKEQVGWYGKRRCNASSVWSTGNPSLTVEFNARPVVSLFVAGDSYYNEYPVDFAVSLYAGASLEHNEVVSANTLLKWTKNISSLGLVSITKMVLTISKWSAPERIVKISEFYTSLYQTFTGDEIVTMSLLEERVIGDGSLPIGNISSNELDLTLNNVAITVDGTEVIDPFFPANVNSVYYELIKRNRRVEPYLGFLLQDGSIEYVKLGVFWTGDWSINEQDYTASVSCRDRMELLRRAEYKTSTLFENTNLYDIAENILNHAVTNIPMTGLTWSIDIELKNYTIGYAWFPRQSYFTTIKQIVEACMGQAYMSKTDVLIIEGPSALTS